MAMSDAVAIERHRTAMARTSLSRPMALALEHGLLGSGTTVFDYGCGRGGDVTHLRQFGVAAAGWDPVHAPDVQKNAAPLVNLGYVLNVIEDPSERVSVLRDAWSLATDTLIVAVRP